GPNAPFTPMDYPEFLRRMKAVIETHSGLGWMERLVFSAWRQPPAMSSGESESRSGRWFNPVLAHEDLGQQRTKSPEGGRIFVRDFANDIPQVGVFGPARKATIKER